MGKLSVLNELRNIIVSSARLPKEGVVPAIKYNNDLYIGQEHSDALDKIVTKYPDVDENNLKIGYYSRLKDLFLPLEAGKPYDARWPGLRKRKNLRVPLNEADIPDNLYDQPGDPP